MLNSFLTAALEVVVLLDILGVMTYFVISGIVRAKKNPDRRPLVPADVRPCPAGPPGYATFPSEVSYASGSSSDFTSCPRGWLSFRSLKGRMGGLRSKTSRADATGIEAGQRRIGMILNSFKEDV